ncbi:MAG: hypothetical protein GY760_18900 [Deltaproteobacteria bacterium]|nr:hypothetical protein [Deltaproteobacteria bacterium]
MKKYIILITITFFFYSTVYASSHQTPIKIINLKNNQNIYETLKAKYPGVTVIEGTPEMINKIQSNPDMINKYKKERIKISEIDKKKDESEKIDKEKDESEKIDKEKDGSEKIDKEKTEDESLEKKETAKSLPNLNLPNIDISKGGPEGLLIIFIVIGVFVTIFLIGYGVGFLYKYLRDSHLWVDVKMQNSFFYNKRNKEGLEYKRWGTLNGIKICLGAGEDKGLGLNTEFGYHNINEEYSNGDENSYDGYYFMTGPVLYYGDIKKTRLSLELLAGTSDRDDIGIISTARINTIFNFNSNFQLGINLGAFYSDLKESDSIYENSDSFTYSVGTTIGWSF